MAFTELTPNNTAVVLPSQQGLQQQLGQYSAMLRQNRMHIQQEKDNRDKEYLMASSFQIDPSITDAAQRAKMIEDVQAYTDKVAKIYGSADSGYLRLSPKQMLEVQNMRNELVGKQSQRMAAQGMYNLAYKEFTDPKNKGLYKEDYFLENANKFKSGELVNDFLKSYDIDVNRALADNLKGVFSPNGSDVIPKDLGGGKTTSFTKNYATSVFDKPPTRQEVTQAVNEIAYSKMLEESGTGAAMKKQMLIDAQNDPQLKDAIDTQNVDYQKQYLGKKYGSVIEPLIYKEDTSVVKGTTVNNYGANGVKPVVVKPNKNRYSFSGNGEGQTPKVLDFSDEITSYKIMDSKGILTDGKAQNVSFTGAKLTGVRNIDGEWYATIKKSKETTVTGVSPSGLPQQNKGKDPIESETIYVPYDQVSSIVEQSGYVLEGFTEGKKKATYSTFDEYSGASPLLFPQGSIVMDK